MNHRHFAPLRCAVACRRMQLKDAHAGIDHTGGKMSLSSSNNANTMNDTPPFTSNFSWGESEVKQKAQKNNKYGNKQEKQPARHSGALWHGALSLSLPPAEGPMVTCSRKHGGYTMETSASHRVGEHLCITVHGIKKKKKKEGGTLKYPLNLL